MAGNPNDALRRQRRRARKRKDRKRSPGQGAPQTAAVPANELDNLANPAVALGTPRVGKGGKGGKSSKLRAAEEPPRWEGYKVFGRRFPGQKRRKSGERLTVTISTYKCPSDLLRKSVRSVLSQTYRNLRLVVIADGNPRELDVLRDIEDPRLVLYALPKNMGQFFAHDLVLRATPDPFFAIQDADDWSDRDRFAAQVGLAAEHGADLVLMGVLHHSPGRAAPTYPRTLEEASADPPRVLPNIGLHVSGIYRTHALRSVGGYYSGLRLGFDTLVVLNVARHGRVVMGRRAYYHRKVRRNSMTNQRRTNMRSSERATARERLNAMWVRVAQHRRPHQTRKLIEASVPVAHAKLRDAEVEKLRKVLERQDKVLNRRAPRFARRRFTVAIVSPRRWAAGGVEGHAGLIGAAFKAAGDRVRMLSFDQVAESLGELDAVVFMGWYHLQTAQGDGQQKSKDFEILEALARRTANRGIPLFVNGTWEGHPLRAKWLASVTKKLARVQPLLRWMVYTPEALRDLRPIRRNLVCLPHPARDVHDVPVPPFVERAGICLGEANKLTHERTMGRFDVAELVRQLKKRLPSAPLYAYAQYPRKGKKPLPDGVTIVQGGDPPKFLRWVASMRLFMSCTVHESYSMVPVEAQALGVPVLFRPMPQSLSSRIGFAGLAFESPARAASLAAELYNDEGRCTLVGEAGRRAAAIENDLELVGLHWHLALAAAKRGEAP